MTVLVSIPLENGESVVFEASDDLSVGGMVLAAKPDEVIERAGRTLEEALDKTLVPVAQAVMTRLAELKPQEVEVTLGLTLSAEAGVIISKVAGEASISVKFKWTVENPSGA